MADLLHCWKQRGPCDDGGHEDEGGAGGGQDGHHEEGGQDISGEVETVVSTRLTTTSVIIVVEIEHHIQKVVVMSCWASGRTGETSFFLFSSRYRKHNCERVLMQHDQSQRVR